MASVKNAVLCVLLGLTTDVSAARLRNTTQGSVAPVLPTKLLALSNQCHCHFQAECSCANSMQFMNCIAAACKSGVCQCEADGPDHFELACNEMSATCPGTELKCDHNQATCVHFPDQTVTKEASPAKLSAPAAEPKEAAVVTDQTTAAPAPATNGRGKADQKESQVAYEIVYWVENLLFGILFYIFVARHYPVRTAAQPNQASKELQDKNAITATLESRFPTLCHSFCCQPARLALTLSAVGVMNYWLALILSIWAPCLTLCLVNSCTDLNVKLGGEKQNPFAACIMSMFCSCCLIAQDAESLDAMLGVQGKVIGAPVKIGQ